eukprot:GILI01001280.1.p1 GENE.GILI01001280.1~~GILI01001280.1.p1  ORF type:complete len:343 (-),score=82.34 GILI01001280.1:113-1141(-)
MDYTPSVILLTGGAGFIGGNVLLHLVKKYPQYRFINLDKLDYCSSLENLKSLEDQSNYKFVKGNILSADLISYLLETEKVDTVMHFAASTHVDNSFGASLDFSKNNIMGTHILLECCKQYKNIKRFIHVSTDEVYGEGVRQDIFGENDTLEPTNPYAASKAAAEHLAKAYFRSFGLPVVITRGNNVYGPGQYPEKLIPKFICRLQRNMKCCIHGNGQNKRSFVYVEDVARAFDTVLHKGVVGEVYNVGTDAEISNMEVARQLISMFGHENVEEWIEYVPDRAFNDCRYPLELTKLTALGFQPVVGFEEGLSRTIQWYKYNHGNWSTVEDALAPHPTVSHQLI